MNFIIGFLQELPDCDYNLGDETVVALLSDDDFPVFECDLLQFRRREQSTTFPGDHTK